jgi:predicted nucleic acid-binding protein
LTVFFVDTSALAKRYVSEVGSTWVRGWTMPAAGHVIVISDLTTVELIAVLARQVRDGKLPVANEAILSSTFLLDVEREYLPIALNEPVLSTARLMVRKHGLRTLDGLQLACALRAVAVLGESLTFVCADNNLLAAAATEGFSTDNPLAHP